MREPVRLPRPTPARRRHLYRAALAFAGVARRVVRYHQARGFRRRIKADDSYVTDAHLAAEQALRRAIRRRFPGHGIVGEEFPPHNPEAVFQWILDPSMGR